MAICLCLMPHASRAATCVENTIGSNSSTQGALSSDDCRISDVLSSNDDSFTDLYVFQLSSSADVSINLTSSGFDSFLRLLNADLSPIAEDDDSGSDFNASITATLAAGTYKILANSATNAAQTGTYTLMLSVAGQTVENTRLINIATRGFVGAGDNVLIGGLVIEGAEAKTVLIRARGPALAEAGIDGALPDPNISFFSGATLIDNNDDWQEHANMHLIPADLRPSNSQESVIVTTLAPGAYTAIVNGINGEEGIGLIEVFEMSNTGETRLINIATRGFVGTGDSVLIAGLVISGTGTQKVVIRAKGPSLSALGVSGALIDPNVTLFLGATVIDSNNNWQEHANADKIPTNLIPTENKEAALYKELSAGAYTAIVTGADDSTGVAIVEVFEVE